MPLQTKTFLELQTEIKREARVEGSDNLDDFVKGLINELLLAYVETTDYQEILVSNIGVTLIAATGLYDLPEDFKTMRFVKYRVGASAPYKPLRRRPQFVEVAQGRLPNYFDIVANQLFVYPYDNVRTDDTLVFDYYAYPAALESDDDVFPIPRLIVPLKRNAIYRVHVYNRDLQVAAALRGESTENEVRSRHTDSANRP